MFTQVFLFALCAISVVTGMVWTSTMQPYTVDAPKKIYFYHMHHVGQSGAVERSTWEVMAIDSSSVLRTLPAKLASLPQGELSGGAQLAVNPVHTFMQVKNPPLHMRTHPGDVLERMRITLCEHQTGWVGSPASVTEQFLCLYVGQSIWSTEMVLLNRESVCLQRYQT